MLYLDASAIAKLVLPEPESEALRAFLVGDEQRVSSVIVSVEVALAVRRARGPAELVEWSRRTLEPVDLRLVDEEVIGVAQRGAAIRTLDAIHLATALTLREELSAFIAYDRRLLRAATEAGLTALSPGLSPA
ncbi:MAG: PIN domain-containing protein [Solirubrobacterales bacterium]